MENTQKIECRISRCLAQRLLPAVPRLGAGDCLCKTHLFYALTEGELRKVVIDLRRTRAAVIMDSAHVLLSAVQPETVARRLGNKETE